MRNRASYKNLDDNAGSWLRLALRRPKDVLSLGVVVAGAGIIAVNALFLQAGPHPAPIFTDAAVAVGSPPPANPASARPKASELQRSTAELSVGTTGATPKPAAVQAKSTVSPPSSASARPDPIAELLEPSNRVIGIQRALAEFGYGQIKPTGNFGPETKAAIEKFERERNLPVTGQISDRLTRELTAMKGRPL